MTYYDNYDDDARYAKEVYWDSKGMGYLDPAPVKPVYVRDTQCPRCKRWASAKEVAYHIVKHPNCNS
jgi:hypothetical protein